jgi:hypothetical protein
MIRVRGKNFEDPSATNYGVPLAPDYALLHPSTPPAVCSQ